jgi:hypothetical protein
MRILINENQLRLITKSVLLEYEVVPYEDGGSLNNQYGYFKFRFVLNDLNYNVFINHTTTKDVYEVDFNYDRDFSHEEQMAMSGTHGIFNAGMDMKHLNSVLYTVLNIVEDVVKKYKLKYIQFTGGRHKDEADGTLTQRTKIYNRFILNKYPNDSVTIDGNKTIVDMTKVFPDAFENVQPNPPDIIYSIIGKYMGKTFSPLEIYQSIHYRDNDIFRIRLQDITPLNGNHIANLEVDVNEDVYYLDVDNSDDYYDDIDSLYKGLIHYLS